MLKRLCRWLDHLTPMEPTTMAGLAAKAEASLAVRDGDRFDHHSETIARAVQNDAVRLAAADARRDAGPSPELAGLVAAWRDADKVACAADDRREQIVETLLLPEPPETLRFCADTDESYIGSYQNHRQPYGYTDRKQIDRLRAGVAAACQARADEIVAAFDAWTDACDAARQAAGLFEAEDAWTRTRNAEATLRRRIVAIPAANAEDLRLKAELAVWCYGTMADVEGELAQAARAGHCGDAEASTAVLLDVVRLANAGALPTTVLPEPSLRPVPLAPIEFPTGRYPAGASREEIETYRTFLAMELRYLDHEIYGRHEGPLHLWLDNPASRLHGAGEPAASSRAAAVLALLGLTPVQGVDGGAQVAVRAA